jgi:hypothetical protein
MPRATNAKNAKGTSTNRPDSHTVHNRRVIDKSVSKTKQSAVLTVIPTNRAPPLVAAPAPASVSRSFDFPPDSDDDASSDGVSPIKRYVIFLCLVPKFIHFVSTTYQPLFSFVPTPFPVGKGPVPPLILKQFNDSLSVGSRMDFMLVSEEIRLTWLKFFADTVIHLNRECNSLKAQLNEYRVTATTGFQQQEKADFVKLVSPTIKSGMFQIFLRLIFPSTLEVTTSKDRRSLVSFGLTEKCGLATLVFESIFNSFQGTASKPLTVVGDDASSFDSSSISDPHEFDTPEKREVLWFDFGIGQLAVKTLNATRNTYTNVVRDVVSKFQFIYLYFPLVLYLTMFLLAFTLIVQKIYSRG